MDEIPEMIEWARRRVDEMAEFSRIYHNEQRTAERDLEGLLRGTPTPACVRRWAKERDLLSSAEAG